jgi:hypothetical protein
VGEIELLRWHVVCTNLKKELCNAPSMCLSHEGCEQGFAETFAPVLGGNSNGLNIALSTWCKQSRVANNVAIIKKGEVCAVICSQLICDHLRRPGISAKEFSLHRGNHSRVSD